MQKKLQEVIEREEREGRVIGGGDENAAAKRRLELQQRLDIDDSDIVIQGSTPSRLSRKQVSTFSMYIIIHYLYCPYI